MNTLPEVVVGQGEKISILVAVRNEQDNIANCLTRLLQVYPRAEIIVIDGGTDNTQLIVESFTEREPTVRYIQNLHDRGKGHATRVGIHAARGAIVAQLDADLQFLPEELPNLIEPIAAGRADVTLGSRFATGSSRKRGSQNLRRSFGNRCVSGIASVLFRHRMTDVMAGMKAWRKEVLTYSQLRCDRYSYEVEIPVRALKAGWRVADVPVTTQARTAGSSSVRVFREGMRTIKDIVLLRCGW